jgi:hypothetical protein
MVDNPVLFPFFYQKNASKNEKDGKNSESSHPQRVRIGDKLQIQFFD